MRDKQQLRFYINRRFVFCGFTVAAILLLRSSITFADYYSLYWQASYGDWSNPDNWSGNEPTSSAWAMIRNGGTAIISQSGEVTGGLELSNVNGASVEMIGGSLSANQVIVGRQCTATFTQSAGNVTLNSGGLVVTMESSSSHGTYTLSGGELNSSSAENIGGAGTGIFNQSGGTNTASDENIGPAGHYNYTGTYNHSAGTNTISNTLNLKHGTYNLSDSAVLSATNQYISAVSSDCVSFFEQTGGSNSATDEYIGDVQAKGTYTQSAGTNTISNNLYLGYYGTDASGSYNLSGTGILSANIEYVGNQNYAVGIFNQTGGSNSASDLYIGYQGTGTYTQSAGTNTISNNLYLGQYNVGNGGTYNLTGGTLVTKSITKGAGKAAFNFGGGTLQASGDFTCSLPMTLTGTNGNANVNTAGYAVELSGVLGGTGGLNKLGSGTLSLSGTNTYSGATNIVQGTLALSALSKISSSSLINVQNGATFNVSAITSGLNLGGAQILKGCGFVDGSIVAAPGSHIKPGDDVGTLTLTGNLTLNSGALLDFELSSISASDKLSMAGSILYLNNQQFSDFSFTALAGFGQGTYTLIDAGAISGDLGSDLSGTIGGLPATLSLSASGYDLVLLVIPESGTLVLLASALVGALFCARLGRK